MTNVNHTGWKVRAMILILLSGSLGCFQTYGAVAGISVTTSGDLSVFAGAHYAQGGIIDDGRERNDYYAFFHQPFLMYEVAASFDLIKRRPAIDANFGAFGYTAIPDRQGDLMRTGALGAHLRVAWLEDWSASVGAGPHLRYIEHRILTPEQEFAQDATYNTAGLLVDVSLLFGGKDPVQGVLRTGLRLDAWHVSLRYVEPNEPEMGPGPGL